MLSASDVFPVCTEIELQTLRFPEQASPLIRIANEPEQHLRLARSNPDHDRARL